MRHPVHVRFAVQTADHNDDTIQHCSIQSMYNSLYGLPTTSTTRSSNADYRPHRRPAPAMQHPVNVRLAVRASNHIDTPPVNPIYFKNRDIDLPTSTNINYPHRTSICLSTTTTNTSYSPRSSSCFSTTPANISYLPRLTSCLSTTSTIPATDISHLADDIDNNP